MKYFSVILFSLFVFQVSASSLKKIEAAAANSMDSILSDTVNEGEGQAKVDQVKCSSAKKKNDPTVNVIRCDMNFAVSYGNAKCSTSCFMIYTMKNIDLKTLTPNSGLEDRCIENLSGTYCD